MSLKKVFLTIALLFFISVFGFSQMAGLGLMGTYNPNNPSFWSAGIMMHFAGEGSSVFFRFGVTFGEVTMTYEQANLFTSTNEMTEYYRKGFYWETIAGGGYQIIFNNFIGLRFGGDLYLSVSPVWINFEKNEAVMFDVGLTGLVGVTLFPSRLSYIHLDVCPGFTIVDKPNSYNIEDMFAFILPIRVTVGFGVK